MSLALWLRTGRTNRGLSLQDVTRVTKIQPRILELLEGGKLEGLPAEVFVRGFIRSYAKCCGLDQAEALARYAAASQAQALATSPATPSTLSAPPAARSMVDADLAQLARTTKPIEVPIDFAVGSLPEITPPPIETVVEASVEPARTSQPPRKKKRRGGKRAKRSSLATGTPPSPTPIVEAAAEPNIEVEAAPVIEAPIVVEPVVEVIAPVDHLDPLVVPTDHEECFREVIATETWQPKMPPATTTASVPWRRTAYVATSTAACVPTLVIDDADPEHAAQVLEDRQAATSVLTNAQRRSFLPPILLDREDRGARQGGLTLAVIILLIAATLTLSYLMRRPSSSGDGVTLNATETQLVG